MVEKKGGSLRAKLVFWSAWLTLLPWVALLSVSGGGAFVIAPIVMLLGCSIIGAFREAAFPEAHCSECGASLEGAPEVQPEPEAAAQPASAALASAV